VDVVALAQDRCYVAVNTKTRFPSLFVHRYKRNETEKGGEELEEGCVFRVFVLFAHMPSITNAMT